MTRSGLTRSGLTRSGLTWAAVIALAAALVTAPPSHAVDSPPADARVTPRVVNGEPGPSADFNSLIAIGDRQRYRTLGMYKALTCGGTLASPSLVITAAHCVDKTSASSLVAGTFPDGDLTSAGGRVVNIVSIAVHPRYERGSVRNDIAVVTLAEPLLGVDTLTPATSDEAETLTAARAPASVAGWGAINQRAPWRFTSIYRIGQLVVFPTSSCGGGEPFTIDGVRFLGYGPGAVDARVMLCAEGVRDGTPVDSCVGDSGGPLVGGTGTGRRLIGVVSWGLAECSTRDGAGVYTRVSAMTQFLMDAGVPFTPQPTDQPLPPTITKVTTTTASMTMTLSPAAMGISADEYVVSARDRAGDVTTCSVAAPPPPETATCIITDLATGTYVVSAISVAEGIPSIPSAERTVTLAGLPSRPRIVFASAEPGRVAGFVVANIRGNGSPIITKRVRCSAPGHPARSGPIDADRVALVYRLSVSTTYSCVAIVTNANGTATSAQVRLTAR